jgi:hypothetical protein
LLLDFGFALVFGVRYGENNGGKRL